MVRLNEQVGDTDVTPARLRQIEEIFHTALECEPPQRDAWLAKACGDDEFLRRKVKALLSSYQQATDFIEEPPAMIAAEVIRAESERADLRVGRTISHYKVVEHIGTGGMGEVYLALDTRSERKAALKLLPLRFVGDAERFRRFQQEARTVIALNHPNIVTIYEIGEEDSTYYIVSELVEGETVQQRLARGAMPVAEALQVALQVASALAAAHRAGVIHRDIKPANVMLRSDGYVKVLDFGIAKLTTDRTAADGMHQQVTFLPNETQVGKILGTPGYMSPEQASGLAATERTDVWALGVLLYEMLGGARPTAGEPKTARSIVSTLPAALRVSEVSSTIGDVIAKALANDPDERFPTMEAMREALNTTFQRIEAGRLARPKHRHARLWAILAPVLAVGAIVVWTYVGRSRVHPPAGGSQRDAYVLYARASELLHRITVPSREDYDAAATLLQQAIGIDPYLALAHARLSYTYSLIEHFFDPSDERREQAISEATVALRLQPRLGEAHQALAYCYYWGKQDYSAAEHELQLATEFLPNDSQNFILEGAMARRQGHYTQSIASFRRALELEPDNIEAAHLIEQTYTYLRDWPNAIAAQDKIIGIVHDQSRDVVLKEKLTRAYLLFYQTENVSAVSDLLAQTATGRDPDGMISLARLDIALLQRNFAAGEKAIKQCKLDPIPGPLPLSKRDLLGQLQRARGDSIATVKDTFDIPIRSLELESLAHPSDALKHALLGLHYSYVGRKEEALREGRRSLDLVGNTQSLEAGQLAAALAVIETQIGEPDQAIELLRELLVRPGVAGESIISITIADLRLRWEWGPLRNDPRFQQLISRPEPRTNYE